MKRISVIGTAALFLVIGAIAPAYAQKDDEKGGGKPAEEKQSKPAQQHTQRNRSCATGASNHGQHSNSTRSQAPH